MISESPATTVTTPPAPAAHSAPDAPAAHRQDRSAIKVCIVGQNASCKFGGEAALPWLCFKFMRQRGIDAHLVAHERTRAEVLAGFPDDHDRLHFAPDTRTERFIWRCGRLLPNKIDVQTLTILRQIYNQKQQRKIVRRLIAEKKVDIVHEINPISPKQVSLMHGLGVPVVIGPLAGGMSYPPAFRFMESRLERFVESFGRATASLLNALIPGKKRAEALIIANDQARRALPPGVRGRLIEIPDVGVNLAIWNRQEGPARADNEIRFVYLGRIVELKGIYYLLRAFEAVARQEPRAVLYILGDGDERAKLEGVTRELKLTHCVKFLGWVTADQGARTMRESDVFVFPSLHEAGGNVVLEAMAVGLPVIITRWGGPEMYVTDDAGIRVPPDGEQQLIDGLAEAMLKLAASPELRRQMGEAGMRRVRESLYDWNQKIDKLMELYGELLAK